MKHIKALPLIFILALFAQGCQGGLSGGGPALRGKAAASFPSTAPTPAPTPTPIPTPVPTPTPIPAPSPILNSITSDLSWKNASFSSQSPTFQAVFDIIPNGSNIDAVTGLSNGPAGAYTDLAAIVRFNNLGFIDVRSGTNYFSDVSLGYISGSSYHFRMVVNVGTHLYSVYVTPPGGVEITLAQDYAFRSEQASVAQLNNRAINADIGSHTLSGFSVSSVPIPVVSFSFQGLLRDRVGQGDLSFSPDGMGDGTFKVQLASGSGNRKVVGLELRNDPGGIWDSIGGNVTWILAAALGLDTVLLNNSSNASVNFALNDGGAFYIFASDVLPSPTFFSGGTGFTLKVTFDDGTVSTASTTVISLNQLAAYWKFDEGSGSIALDSSGNNNTGTLVNMPTYSIGKVGTAANFNGISSSVNVPNSSFLSPSTAFTLAAWVNPSAAMSDFRAVMAKNYDFFLYASVQGYCGNGGLMAGFASGAGYITVCSPVALPSGVWTHLAVTYDGVNLVLYRNGVQAASVPASGLVPAAGGNFQIGASQYGEYFPGLIDEAIVYGRALNAKEVSALARGQTL